MNREDALAAVSAERDRQSALWAAPHAHGQGDCSSANVPLMVKVAVLPEMGWPCRPCTASSELAELAALNEADTGPGAPMTDSDLPFKLTRVNRRRLLVLLTDAANLGGSTIWLLAGGSSGQAYIFLAKLETAGWVVSDWEAPEPLDRPRRRFYHLTPEGRAAAMKALKLQERWDSDDRHGSL